MTPLSHVDLHGAVERGEIVAYYQPQVDIDSGRIVAVEALSRWNHPELGIVPPDVFIPIAEESGLIHEIGRFMIEEGCRRAASWKERGIVVDIAINVSARQLEATQFFDDLTGTIRDLTIPPRQVTIEITESLPIENVATVVERLEELRQLGLGISIDDFGIGYSSIDQVEALPVTELKLDQSLVRDPEPDSLARMQEIITLVKARGIRVVAEGVETDEQLERVRALHCDRAQGYLIAKPMPVDDLEQLLLAS